MLLYPGILCKGFGGAAIKLRRQELNGSKFQGRHPFLPATLRKAGRDVLEIFSQTKRLFFSGGKKAFKSPPGNTPVYWAVLRLCSEDFAHVMSYMPSPGVESGLSRAQTRRPTRTLGMQTGPTAKGTNSGRLLQIRARPKDMSKVDGENKGDICIPRGGHYF